MFQKSFRCGDGTQVDAVKKLVVSASEAKAYYYFYRDGSAVVGTPVKDGGDDVSSEMNINDYGYTHGGGLFKAATDIAKGLMDCQAIR